MAHSILDVRHQPRAQRLIQRALASDRLASTQLFCGPEGVGREMLARRLSAILLCESPAHRLPDGVEGFERWHGTVVDACGECESCRACGSDVHPDLHIVDRELIKQHPDPAVRGRKGLTLSIEVVRAFVIERAASTSTLGRAKSFIVRDAHLMNVAAQNALLKTLEEPPASTYLFLLASTSGDLLGTVRSRSALAPFDPLPSAFIVKHLLETNPDVTQEQADLCAEHACGSLGIAQRMLGDELFRHEAALVEILGDLPSGDVIGAAKRMISHARELGDCHRARDDAISETEAQRRGLTSLFGLMGIRLRRAMRAACEPIGAGEQSQSTPTDTIAKLVSPQGLGDAARTVAAAEWHLERNVNVQLCVEAMLIRLSRVLAA